MEINQMRTDPAVSEARRKLTWLLAAAVVVGALTGNTFAYEGEPSRPLEDRWYVVQLRGQRAGYMRDRVDRAAGKITTRSEMVLKILREKSEVEMRFVSEFVETDANRPVSMRSEQRLGANPDMATYTFLDDGVEVVRSGTTGEVREKKPRPEGAWLTPRQVENAVRAALLAKDTKPIVVRTVDPLLGLDPTTVTHAIIDRKAIAVMGRDTPAIMWETTTDRFPGVKSVEFVDDSGNILQSETDLGGIRLTVVRADRDLALSRVEPPELLRSTLITPNIPIDRPRTAVKAEYLVRSTGDVLPDLPTAGAQRSTRRDVRSTLISVDVYNPGVATAAEIADQSYRIPSAMINSADPEIIKLRDKAVGLVDPGAKPQTRAQAMRRAVAGWIARKDLDVGFASASEVARTQRGDCSEHAVLLAAMLRADNIPSRVVSGLVYVPSAGAAGNGHFGYHMWTQALVDGDNGTQVWIDYDATMPASTQPGAVLNTHVPFDATHIALGISALADGATTTNDLVRLAPLIGTLSIEVENVDRSVLSR